MKRHTIYFATFLFIALTLFSGINSQYHGSVEGLNLRIGKRYFPLSVQLDESYQHDQLLKKYKKTRKTLMKLLIQVIHDMDSD
jgi:hypothetical protein